MGSISVGIAAPFPIINRQRSRLYFPYSFKITSIPLRYCTSVRAKKPNPKSETLLPQSTVEEMKIEEEDEFLFDDFDDEELLEDDYYSIEDDEPCAGDGGGGGGIKFAGTSWDKEALATAEEVCLSFDGDIGLYAFKTLANNTVCIRIEKLSNKFGSPNMADIEAFSKAYRARLDDAEVAGSIPENISLEVSSPGLDRVVRIPQDLERFKERNMYVKYVSTVAETGVSCEYDGVFRLMSYDLERKCCTWGIADVRVNREKAGKGRPLNKKQREWRVDTPFESLLLCRKQKASQEADNIRVDEHMKIKEDVVEGPHGAKAVVLTIEDDVHIEEEMRKNEKFGRGMHANEILNANDIAQSSSNSGHHRVEQKAQPQNILV